MTLTTPHGGHTAVLLQGFIPLLLVEAGSAISEVTILAAVFASEAFQRGIMVNLSCLYQYHFQVFYTLHVAEWTVSFRHWEDHHIALKAWLL